LPRRESLQNAAEEQSSSGPSNVETRSEDPERVASDLERGRVRDPIDPAEFYRAPAGLRLSMIVASIQ
jgi:hypothetical protein